MLAERSKDVCVKSVSLPTLCYMELKVEYVKKNIKLIE